MTRTLIALILMTAPALAGCGRHDETGNDTFDVHLCATVAPYCIVGDDHVPCEDIPVMPLTDDDLEPLPPAMDVVNARRLNDIETAGNE